ncbi:hypothetical protein GCM10027169_27120 [Gordonia jinhuaensis]|uniref:HTH tetR-type domain-containing protein n=1 Tax=Gordonia jinhuaensis TaxID=1517702 RepID=A0A916WVQ2_9ACTN|nr:TetR/AcrR family transcriptional regulator [Gordonia jinhuaensis]GGB37819.1 hypothetical protein GCM10011489_26990 [Gordonia jinhuaensis]
MAGVNTSRDYDSSNRRRRARERREDVIAAAIELFTANGYRTTIAQVADAAGVSPESIYKSFAGKAGLIKEALDRALAGDDSDLPVAERPESRAIDDEPDVRGKLALFAATAAERNNRAAPLQLVIREGASHDRAIAELWKTIVAQRLQGMTMLAEHLVETGGLRPGASVPYVRDTLWALIAPELFGLLVADRGWSLEEYRDWLARALIAQLT